VVNFANTVVIMTSNLGSDYLLQAAAVASRPGTPDYNAPLKGGRPELKVGLGWQLGLLLLLSPANPRREWAGS
jgi:hypothetical protein